MLYPSLRGNQASQRRQFIFAPCNQRYDPRRQAARWRKNYSPRRDLLMISALLSREVVA